MLLTQHEIALKVHRVIDWTTPSSSTQTSSLIIEKLSFFHDLSEFIGFGAQHGNEWQVMLDDFMNPIILHDHLQTRK
jgi:hypothetical protein